MARVLGLAAFVIAAGATSVSAETLMMPKRDARMNVPVVVWGVTTQSPVSACTLDYGDGSPVTICNGADRSYIAFAHTYATQATFTATLTVGAETSTVDVRVFDVAQLPGGATGDANRGLGINMAIQDGLRNLWTAQSSRAANFPAGVSTNWGNGFPYADAALIVLAFENHGYSLANDGSAPTGLYEKYIVRRGLNYVMSTLSAVTLGVTPQGDSACIGGLGVAAGDCGGLRTPADPGYSVAVAMLPFAASGALARVNTEVGGATAGMTFGQILQRLSNAEAWGMTDGVGNPRRGGVGYQLNGGQFDGSTAGWAILGFLDAAAAGATVPAWVSTEFKFGFDNNLAANGSFGYSGFGDNPGPAKVGIGLQGLYFTGVLSGARVDAVKANISSWWPGAVPFGIGGNAWGGHNNHGGAYAMFNIFKGLKLQGITTLPDVNRSTRPWAFLGTVAEDDWHADYQDWLIANQSAPNTTFGGSWGPPMSFSCCYSGDAIETAIAELILSPVALVLPDGDKFGAFGLTPVSNTAIELNSHTVTAHAESTGGTPVPGATVNFIILTGPNAGLIGTDTTDANGEATFTYTDGGPLGTVGTDTIRASIGSLNSNIVEMIWTPQNSPPVATDNSYITNEDTALLANAVTDGPADSDPDADTLTATLLSGVSNGTLVFTNGAFTYTPAANFCGQDSFTYSVNDGTVDSNTATVTIAITCVNDVPLAADDSATTAEDTAVTASVTGNDTAIDLDGDTLVWTQTSSPLNGGLSFTNGSYTYTPNPNFCGSDGFTYTIGDGFSTSPATVSLTVLCVNDPPVAVDDAYTGQWNTLLVIAAPGVQANDSDIDSAPLSALSVTGTSHGTVTLNVDGSFTYLPLGNYSGTDSFTYKLNDGALDSNTATVVITITTPCRPKGKKHTHHFKGDGHGEDHDVDHDGDDDGDHDGDDDGDHDDDDGDHDGDDDDDDDNDGPRCAPGTPKTNKDNYSMKQDTTLTLSAKKGVRKNDGKQPTTIELWSNPSHGTLTLAADGSFVYTPTPGFIGTDTFYYVARSTSGIASHTERVTIHVTKRHGHDDDCSNSKHDHEKDKDWSHKGKKYKGSSKNDHDDH